MAKEGWFALRWDDTEDAQARAVASHLGIDPDARGGLAEVVRATLAAAYHRVEVARLATLLDVPAAEWVRDNLCARPDLPAAELRAALEMALALLDR